MVARSTNLEMCDWLEKKQQGPIIYISLPDKIRNSCRDVTVSELNKDEGLNLLINKLAKLYVKDTKASAYLAYEKFESFQHPTNMNIIDYLNEFERLLWYTKIWNDLTIKSTCISSFKRC